MTDDIIDLNEVLERVENDRELLSELMDIFEQDYPGRIKNLKKAVEEKNIVLVKEVAHSLKGAAANISAKKISGIFLDIENMAKIDDLSRMQEAFIKLEGYIKELSAFSAKFKKELHNP